MCIRDSQNSPRVTAVVGGGDSVQPVQKGLVGTVGVGRIAQHIGIDAAGLPVHFLHLAGHFRCRSVPVQVDDTCDRRIFFEQSGQDVYKRQS